MNRHFESFVYPLVLLTLVFMTLIDHFAETTILQFTSCVLLTVIVGFSFLYLYVITRHYRHHH